MSLLQIALVSVASGIVFSMLCLAFCRLALDIFSKTIFRRRTLSEFWTVFLQGIVCVVICTGAVVPLYSFVKARFDIPSIMVGGPLMTAVGMIVFLVGGGYRWGKPPEYMWAVLGSFIVYVSALHVLLGFWVHG